MNRNSEQNHVHERRNERTEESTIQGINKHTSILWNDMYPLYRRRSRTISAAGRIQRMRLEVNPQRTIANGSRSLSMSSFIGTDPQAENSNDRRVQITFLREEQEESTLTRRRRRSEGGEGHHSAPSILQRSEDNATGTDSSLANPPGLNDE